MVSVLRAFGRDARRVGPSSWTVGRRWTDRIEGERRVVEARIERQAQRLARYRSVPIP